jgi:exodeoxyribonuclease VII small subunit
MTTSPGSNDPNGNQPNTNDPNTDDPNTDDPAPTAGTGPDAAATYEQARDELASVVARLETGGLSLDESLELWERGEHLAVVCTRFLDGGRQRVEDALQRNAAENESSLRSGS